MKNFLNEIERISEALLNIPNQVAETISDTPAVEKLFELTEMAIDIFSKRGIDYVKLHKLPRDLLPLLFTFENESNGFVINTDKKYIFVIGCQPNKIFIYGINI